MVLFPSLFSCCCCCCCMRGSLETAGARTSYAYSRSRERARGRKWGRREGNGGENRRLSANERCFFFFFLHSLSFTFHSAAVISGVRHPASTTTVTSLVLLLLLLLPDPPLVGESEAEAEEEETAAAERRLAFRAGEPASRAEVELIPREGGTERCSAALLLLLQATREEAAAAETREKTREAGRPAVFRGGRGKRSRSSLREGKRFRLNLFCFFHRPSTTLPYCLEFPSFWCFLSLLTSDGQNREHHERQRRECRSPGSRGERRRRRSVHESVGLPDRPRREGPRTLQGPRERGLLGVAGRRGRDAEARGEEAAWAHRDHGWISIPLGKRDREREGAGKTLLQLKIKKCRVCGAVFFFFRFSSCLQRLAPCSSLPLKSLDKRKKTSPAFSLFSVSSLYLSTKTLEAMRAVNMRVRSTRASATVSECRWHYGPKQTLFALSPPLLAVVVVADSVFSSTLPSPAPLHVPGLALPCRCEEDSHAR